MKEGKLPFQKLELKVLERFVTQDPLDSKSRNLLINVHMEIARESLHLGKSDRWTHHINTAILQIDRLKTKLACLWSTVVREA